MFGRMVDAGGDGGRSALYGLCLVAVVARVIGNARRRVLDVPGALHACLYLGGHALAAWLIPVRIAALPYAPP